MSAESVRDEAMALACARHSVDVEEEQWFYEDELSDGYLHQARSQYQRPGPAQAAPGPSWG